MRIINFSKKIFNSSFGLVIITALLYSLFIGVILKRNNFDFSHFITAGNIYTNAGQMTEKIKILKKCGPEARCGGYDGQFYYRLSLNPFTAARTDYGITIDLPALRQQRILYPILTRIFSLGINSIIPATMVLINYFALCLMAWFAGQIMKFYNKNIYWGLLLPLYPGFLFSLSRDLTEILGICLLTIAFWAFLKKKNIMMSIFASLAVLARETNLIFTLGILFFYLYEIIFKKRKTKISDGLIFAMPLIIFLIWQLILARMWPENAVGSSFFYNITLPFAGLKYHLLNGRLINKQNIIEMVYVFSIIISSIAALKISKIAAEAKFAWLIAFLIFIMISKSIWIEDWSFMRAFTDLYFFSALILLASNASVKFLIASFTLIMWTALFKIAVIGQLF